MRIGEYIRAKCVDLADQAGWLSFVRGDLVTTYRRTAYLRRHIDRGQFWLTLFERHAFPERRHHISKDSWTFVAQQRTPLTMLLARFILPSLLASIENLSRLVASMNGGDVSGSLILEARGLVKHGEASVQAAIASERVLGLSTSTTKWWE